MVPQERHLLRGRHVQDVDARAGLARDAHEALACRRAPPPPSARPAASADRPRRAGPCARAASPRPRNGMPRGGGCGAGSRRRPVVLDEERAGRRAHEHLDAGGARQALQFRRPPPRSRACRRPRRRNRNACDEWPRRTLSASASALVVCGSVFGISNTAVTPPMTAAREPDSRSSLWSRPGSRKCTCVSMTPGRMCSPLQSTTRPAEARERSPIVDDRAAGDADVPLAAPVLVHDGAALEDEVEGLGHEDLLSSRAACRPGPRNRSGTTEMGPRSGHP